MRVCLDIDERALSVWRGESSSGRLCLKCLLPGSIRSTCCAYPWSISVVKVCVGVLAVCRAMRSETTAPVGEEKHASAAETAPA